MLATTRPKCVMGVLCLRSPCARACWPTFALVCLTYASVFSPHSSSRRAGGFENLPMHVRFNDLEETWRGRDESMARLWPPWESWAFSLGLQKDAAAWKNSRQPCRSCCRRCLNLPVHMQKIWNAGYLSWLQLIFKFKAWSSWKTGLARCSWHLSGKVLRAESLSWRAKEAWLSSYFNVQWQGGGQLSPNLI